MVERGVVQIKVMINGLIGLGERRGGQGVKEGEKTAVEEVGMMDVVKG